MPQRARPHAPCVHPTRAECAVAREAAKEAVSEVFALLGVDVKDPGDVEEFRKDLRFGGSMRKTWEKSVIAAIAVIVGGCLAAFWTGITMKIGGE